jgi:large repetitive protein
VRRFLTMSTLALTLGAIGSPAQAAASISIPPVTLFPATSGIFYSATVTAAGGTAPYTYSVVSGALPRGLSFSSVGTMSGIPDDSPGLFTFMVQAVDVDGNSATTSVTLELATPTILLASVAIPDAKVGVPYRYTLSALGGTPGYVFSVSDGSLPAGLSLSSDGVFTGAPTTAGISLFTVQITDARGIRGLQTFRLVVDRTALLLRKTRARLPKLPRFPR